MQKITPKDFSILYKNIIIIKDLYKKCSKDKKIKTYLEEFVEDYNNIHKNSLKINKEIDEFLDLKLCESIDDISCERLGNYDTEKLFFIKKDIYPDLDKSYKKSEKQRNSTNSASQTKPLNNGKRIASSSQR